MKFSRRTTLSGAAAIAAVAILPAKAQGALQVPAVDRLEVLFVIDGSVHTFAEPVRRGDL